MSVSILHKRRSLRLRPRMEMFEDRVVPSTFTVTNTLDSGPGSLRAAVQQSNLNVGADTINFSPALSGPITLTTGQIDITDDVTVANTNTNISISGNNSSRIFETHGVNVTISGLTLQNGYASGASSTPGSGGDGGAIQQDGGTLTLTGDRFLNNKASYRGGAVFNFYGTLNAMGNQYLGNYSASHGGAIYNSGAMTELGGVYIGNVAAVAGGAIDDASSILAIQGVNATLTGDVFASNSASVFGGAVNVE